MSTRTTPDFVSFGDFRLDLDRSRLTRHDEPVSVPQRALDVLMVLVRHRDRVVSKSELLEQVWPDTNVEEANLSQQVFTLRRILGDDPESPRFIQTLPRRGYRFIADVAADPEDETQPGAQFPNEVPPAGRDRRTQRGWWLVIAAVAAASIAGVIVGFALRAAPAPPSIAFDVGLPEGITLDPRSGFAISPDQRAVVFAAGPDKGPDQLYLRRFDSAEAKPLPGTEQPNNPFWSPDGRRVGFFSRGRLRTLSVDGGVPVELCSALDARGGTWGANDVILFAAGSRSTLYQISANGGQPVPVTALDANRRDISHRFPRFLPDGRHFLVLVWSGDTTREGIHVGEIGHPELTRVSADMSPAGWLDGRLAFVRHERLVAQPIDSKTMVMSGDALELASPVARAPTDSAPFAAAPRAVAFVRSRFEAHLVWVDRTGHELQAIGGPGQYDSPVVSPDGRNVLVAYRDRARGNENFDIWMSTIAGGDRTRITFDRSVDTEPVWSPDGRDAIFRSNRSGFSDIYRKTIRSAQPETLLFSSRARKDVSDWSPDGKQLLFSIETDNRETDIWSLPIAGGAPTPVVSVPGSQTRGRFSPDGRAIAYESTESGRLDVYVQMLGASAARYRVAAGRHPAWRGDGRELFFLDRSGIGAVDVTIKASGPAFSEPHHLFDTRVQEVVGHAFTVSADGQRFLLAELLPSPPPVLSILLNPSLVADAGSTTRIY